MEEEPKLFVELRPVDWQNWTDTHGVGKPITVAVGRKIEVRLEEAVRLFLVLEKFHEFHCDPTRFEGCTGGFPPGAIARRSKVIFPELHEVLYYVVLNWLPEDVRQRLREHRKRDAGSDGRHA
jgi:hypothetical protein